MDPAFVTKREPHLTADLLRQGWGKLKSFAPGLQSIEDWGDRTSATAAAEGGLRALTPEEPWEVPLMGFGKFPKLAIGASAAMAGGDAEAATGMRKVLYDLLRANKGDLGAAKQALETRKPSMSKEDRAQATKVLKADIPRAVVEREVATNTAQPTVHEILDNRRAQTLLMPDQAFKVGDVLVPFAGDTTHAGMKVKRAGIDLKNPVEMQGGHEYGLTGPQGWASELAAARAKQNSVTRAEAATRGTGEVKGVHVAMAPEGAFFAKHTPELWMEMLRSGPSIDPMHQMMFSTDVQRQLKTGKMGGPESAKVRALREWQGVSAPNAQELIDTNPELRKALMFTAAKPGWQHLGFPDTDELFAAALDQGLRTGDVGGAVLRGAPGADLMPSAGHRTYGFDIPTEHVGRLRVPLPPEIAFPETMARFGPTKRAQALGSLRTAHTERPVDQKFIDEASAYTEEVLKRLRGQ